MTSPFGSVDGMAFGNQTVTFSQVRGSRMVRIMVSSCEEVTVLPRSCTTNLAVRAAQWKSTHEIVLSGITIPAKKGRS